MAAALGQDSTERRRSGTLNTLTSSGSGFKQSAFVFEFVDQGCVAAVPFFFPHIAA